MDSRLGRNHGHDLVIVRIDDHDLVLIDEVHEPAPSRLDPDQRLGHRHHVDLAPRHRRTDAHVEVDMTHARRVVAVDHGRLDLRALLLGKLHTAAAASLGAAALVSLRGAAIGLGAALHIVLAAALHVVLRRTLLGLVGRAALVVRGRAFLVLALHWLRGIAAQALQGVLPLGLPVALRAAVHVLLSLPVVVRAPALGPLAALAHLLRFLTTGLRGPVGAGLAVLLRLALAALALFLSLGLRDLTLTLLLRLGLRALMVHGLAALRAALRSSARPSIGSTARSSACVLR